MKTKLILILLIVIATTGWSAVQQSKPDSVVVKVGEASKIVVTIGSKEDAAILKHYDFQALMNDLITRVENDDTTSALKPQSEYLVDSQPQDAERETETMEEEEDRGEFADEDDGDHSFTYDRSWHRGRKMYHSFSFDIGTNNFLKDGNTFPDADNDAFTVRPFGSWYVGLNSVQRTRIAGKFYLEWGLGVSWYNFKFENNATLVTKDSAGVNFGVDQRDLNFDKSKLTIGYINASFIPVLDFGENRRKPMIFDDDDSDSFRIGAGPYVGYRIGSYTKMVYVEDGDREKERNRGSYYLNNLRYGARLQLGFKDVDLFINYDMNDLFASGRGPSLNAFSFGLIL